MTKQVNPKNQIWYEQDGAITRIGFTRDFLNGMSQCWHILPANRERVNEKSPLMVVETNDALISIVSPVAAHVDHWNDRAQNFPYQLTEEDVILTLRSGGPASRTGAQPERGINEMLAELRRANQRRDVPMPPPQRVVVNNAAVDMNWQVLPVAQRGIIDDEGF